MAKIKDVALTDFSVKVYSKYALYAIENRATPDYRDGLQSVHRRVLWAMHELGLKSTSEKPMKSARVVGDTLGKYHPHGDTACYKAMVTMAGGKHHSNTCQKLIEGTGNWGSLSNGCEAAAARYTEARLSAFSDRNIFDPYYVPAVNMVPNFDSSGQEPEVLPVLLPVLLLNGKFGIAPGLRCDIPCFTLDSIKALLAAVYGGAAVTADLCSRHLVLRTTHGGRAAKTRANREALAELYKRSISGTIAFESRVAYNEATKTATVTAFAVDRLERPLKNLSDMAGIAYASDDSRAGDPYATVVVRFNKTCDAPTAQLLLQEVKNAFACNASFRLNVSHRKFVESLGDVEIGLLSPSLVELIDLWVQWRVELEVKATEHWIGITLTKTARQNILLCAVRNRVIIMESLERKEPIAELAVWLARRLDISPQDARAIYELQLLRLRALEEKPILDEIKRIEEERKALVARKNKPLPAMLKQLEHL